MDSQFWIKAWNEGRTNFNQEDYHDKLTEYFPQLIPRKGQRVLVPLCGKSKDLLWLHGLNLHVHGIELHDQAVESFFSENELSPLKKTQEEDFIHYTHENIVISCGDFFKLNENDTYDFIYDRASLVALPSAMRKSYAQMIKQSLKKGGNAFSSCMNTINQNWMGHPLALIPMKFMSFMKISSSLNWWKAKSRLKKGLGSHH